MTPHRLMWHLPQRLAQALSEFVFHPSSYIHPDHQAVLYPPTWSLSSSAMTSRALLKTLKLDVEPAVDLHRPLHRLALLSSSTLEALARWLGIAQQSDHLRRVVHRSDLDLLNEVVSPAAWDWIYAQPSAAPRPEMTRSPAASKIREDVMTQGWKLLGLASQTLPDGVAQRLQLKLPRLIVTDLPLSPESAAVRLESIYGATMEFCDPTWEADWQSTFAKDPDRWI